MAISPSNSELKKTAVKVNKQGKVVKSSKRSSSGSKHKKCAVPNCPKFARKAGGTCMRHQAEDEKRWCTMCVKHIAQCAGCLCTGCAKITTSPPTSPHPELTSPIDVNQLKNPAPVVRVKDIVANIDSTNMIPMPPLEPVFNVEDKAIYEPLNLSTVDIFQVEEDYNDIFAPLGSDNMNMGVPPSPTSVCAPVYLTEEFLLSSNSIMFDMCELLGQSPVAVGGVAL